MDDNQEHFDFMIFWSKIVCFFVFVMLNAELWIKRLCFEGEDYVFLFN